MSWLGFDLMFVIIFCLFFERLHKVRPACAGRAPITTMLCFELQVLQVMFAFYSGFNCLKKWLFAPCVLLLINKLSYCRKCSENAVFCALKTYFAVFLARLLICGYRVTFASFAFVSAF